MPNHQITWEDAQQMPDDDMRYEAIGGELIVTPAANLRHQDIVLRLALQLQATLVEPGHGRPWVSSVGVEFPATSEGVQPDLVFVSNEPPRHHRRPHPEGPARPGDRSAVARHRAARRRTVLDRRPGGRRRGSPPVRRGPGVRADMLGEVELEAVFRRD